jgi:hypothetical protein
MFVKSIHCQCVVGGNVSAILDKSEHKVKRRDNQSSLQALSAWIGVGIF